jgi:hypothetical protein
VSTTHPRAKNLVSAEERSTKTGLAVQALQAALPNAGVLYSSATGASEPLNMGYMSRLLPPGFKTTFEMIEMLKVCWIRQGWGGWGCMLWVCFVVLLLVLFSSACSRHMPSCLADGLLILHQLFRVE